MNLAGTVIETPLGRYGLTASDAGLTHVQLEGSPKLPETGGAPSHAARRHLDLAVRALREYFGGQREHFDDVVTAADGTAFQNLVWRELMRIPYGGTESYGGLARRIGVAGAARAVGTANRDNPLGIVVPCHRVIGADGTLTGYAGGLERKRWLLVHEGVRQDSI